MFYCLIQCKCRVFKYVFPTYRFHLANGMKISKYPLRTFNITLNTIIITQKLNNTLNIFYLLIRKAKRERERFKRQKGKARGREREKETGERERWERERVNLPSANLFPKLLHQLGLGQAEGRSWEFHWGLPCQWQGYKQIQPSAGNWTVSGAAELAVWYGMLPS